MYGRVLYPIRRMKIGSRIKQISIIFQNAQKKFYKKNYIFIFAPILNEQKKIVTCVTQLKKKKKNKQKWPGMTLALTIFSIKIIILADMSDILLLKSDLQKKLTLIRLKGETRSKQSESSPESKKNKTSQALFFRFCSNKGEHASFDLEWKRNSFVSEQILLLWSTLFFFLITMIHSLCV